MNEIKLHLGCGKRYLPGYIHVDLDSHSHIDYCHSISTLPMFENESVNLIYSCGSLSYFDREECADVLKEWRRVLKPEGILRLSLPDFESIVKVYLQNGKDLDGEGILGPIFGKWKITSENGEFKNVYQKTVYDYNSLKKLLNDNGFVDYKKYDWWDVLPSYYDDYSMAYVPYKDTTGIQMCLNIECVKGI